MSYLIDTNVISELRKGDRADRRVMDWFTGLPEDDVFLSVLTIGEIRRGIESIRRRDLDAASALESWLSRMVDQHEDRILGISRSVAEEWGRINVPDPLPAIDGLLAATARVADLTVATRNVEDLARAGVGWVNPFTGASG